MTPRLRRSSSVSGPIVISLIAGLVVAGSPVTASPPSDPPPAMARATEGATRVAPPTPPPATPPAPQPPSPQPPGSAEPSAATIDLANQRRATAGRAPLSQNAALTAAALQHSADQAAHGRMSHTGSDGSTVGQRIEANGGSFRTWGENVAAGFTTADRVVAAWMNSAGHRRNILNPAFTQIGVGYADGADGTRYWTMVLAG